MKKKLLLVGIAILSMFSAMATVVPVTSTPGNDTWYYIKCNPRNPNNSSETWLSVTTLDSLTYTSLSADDALLWKVVENGTGVALVNKKTGYYVDADNRRINKLRIRITSKPTMPTTPLRLVPSSGYTNLSWPGWDGKTPGIFILDNTAATTVDAANKITVNDAEAAFALTIYSPVSGTFIVANQPGWVANPNQVVLFMTQKEMLMDAINGAKAMITNSSIGLNPGQYPQEAVDNLQLTIDYAMDVYNNETSTVQEYIDAYNDIISTTLLYRSYAIKPEISTQTENWYYIQGTRPANTYLTAGAPGAALKDLTVVPNDNQLWKLVPNGSGFAMQNKATGEYVQTDVATGTSLVTQATMPAKPLRFIASSETYNKAIRFWIENTTDAAAQPFRLHAANGNNVMNWTGGANDNCTWLFLSIDELYRTQFIAAKETARTLYNNAVEGDEFGQYSAATRATFLAVLTAEEAKVPSNMTQDDLKAAVKNLTDATAAFKCNNDVSTLSSITKIKWFRFINAQSPAGYATNKAMTSNGRVLDQALTYETKDVNSDAQLFRFELNADGTKATTIINKANNLYVNANGKIASAPQADNEFEITALDGFSFWIKPTTSSAIHAASFQTDIVNWPSGAGSASAWKFEYVKSEDVLDLTPTYLSRRALTRTKYDAVVALGGEEFGQYTAASMAQFGAVLTAEEAKDPATLTQEQLLKGINDMAAAIAGLKVNTDVKLLVSPTTGKTKWFRLINNQSGKGYATDMAMSSNGRIATEHFTYEVKDINSDAQLFRFELTADQTQVAHIVNKANNLYVTADGIMASASTVANNFDITQLDGGRSFWIDPTNTVSPDPNDEYLQTAPLHAAAAGTSIVNWLSGAGSASAWLFEFVKESYPDAVKNVEEFKYKVRTTNNIITVEGIENFEVYSVLGQKQNIKKALSAGVYFVKVNNAVKKVVID